jgi:predicted dehydrogenase/threonine dehydrogenase-like Zn-dependent dehydrogenase
MKQVLIKQGRAVVEDVPAPQVDSGTVLVRLSHSCISIGTEMSGLKASGEPLWKKAVRYPAKVKKAIDMVAERGLSHTINHAQGALTSGQPTGYSAAGVVIAVGSAIHDIAVGDRVACAGAQCAHHAEVINVPRNLTVPIPDGLEFEAACTVTLGAIALQGVRRAVPTLGETFVVLGLGILGQLTWQMLKSNGCRVIGTDLSQDRIDLGKRLGMDAGVYPEEGVSIDQVIRLTDGIGADGVIITAASPSDAIVSTAFQMCRKKGRVVLVGDVGLQLNRADFYQKELDFLISSSYGPGRYDRRYEEEGLDYPVAFVRWTENRNMAEYLRLLNERKVVLSPLMEATYPISEASIAYERLKTDDKKPLMVLLAYPQETAEGSHSRVVVNPLVRPSGKGHIRIAVVGAGGFAKGMHLPNLKALSGVYSIHAIMSRSGPNAVATARQFGAAYSTTDYEAVLKDSDVQAVLIATRHHLHAEMALGALRAGKHVLLEKPLALTRTELGSIQDFFLKANGSRVPMLLTGFNRRFSPAVARIREVIAHRSNPMVLNYRMNAGYLPADHWVHGQEGGGRNIGEACHIYDLFTALTESKVLTVQCQTIRPATQHYRRQDNFIATMTFEDGSLASLTYTALGTPSYPKERLEVFVDGKVLFLDDYKRLTISGATAKGVESASSEKGQREELEIFGRAIQEGGEWPIPLWQQVQATEISFLVEDEISMMGGR